MAIFRVILHRQPEQPHRFLKVLRDPFAAFVHDAQIVARRSMLLLHRLPVPFHRKLKVFLNALAIRIAPAQRILRALMAQLRRLLEHLHRLTVARLRALPVFIAPSKVVSPLRRTVLCRLLIPVKRAFLTPANPEARIIIPSKTALRVTVACFRALLRPARRLFPVLRHALPVLVAPAKPVHRRRVILRRRLFEQANRALPFLRLCITVQVKQRKVEQRARLPLPRSQLVPPHSFRDIGRSPIPVAAAPAIAGLPVRVSLFSGFAIPFRSLGGVFFRPERGFIAPRQVIHRAEVVLLRCPSVPQKSFLWVTVPAARALTANCIFGLRRRIALFCRLQKQLHSAHLVLGTAFPAAQHLRKVGQRARLALRRRPFKPYQRFLRILRDADPMPQAPAIAGLPIKVVLLRSDAVQPGGFLQIAFHTVARFIAPAQIIGGADIPLLRGKAVPFDRFLRVAPRAAPALIRNREFALCARVPLLR